ncbi:MAG: phosphotransferase, partial [Candidatus Moranbacteria bacterium]|nr:phosphotransferase [Candidatus Moranbacteria bacterium]
LTTLHSTPKTVVDKFSVRIDSPDENYIRLLDDTKKTLFSRFNKDEIKITNEFFSELKDVLRHEYLNALVHNDLTSKNMFWDSEKKRINIIDFSDRSFSDPAIDFAGLWELSEELVEKVYKLYDGRKDNKFLYRSKLYYKRIPFLMMRGALEGYPGSFQGGYKVFRKRFKLI